MLITVMSRKSLIDLQWVRWEGKRCDGKSFEPEDLPVGALVDPRVKGSGGKSYWPCDSEPF